MTGISKKLAAENRMVLDLVQAMLGLVSPPVLGVSLEISAEAIIVHVAVSRTDDEINEDIEEMSADFQGFLWPDTPRVIEKVHVGPADQTWAGRNHRLVFLAKGSDGSGEVLRDGDASFTPE